MNINIPIPWWVVCGLAVFLLIWKTTWMNVLEWLAGIGFILAIIAGIIVVGFVVVSVIILPWTSKSKMCDPRVSLKEWQKIKTQKGG